MACVQVKLKMVLVALAKPAKDRLEENDGANKMTRQLEEGANKDNKEKVVVKMEEDGLKEGAVVMLGAVVEDKGNAEVEVEDKASAEAEEAVAVHALTVNGKITKLDGVVKDRQEAEDSKDNNFLKR